MSAATRDVASSVINIYYKISKLKNINKNNISRNVLW